MYFTESSYEYVDSDDESNFNETYNNDLDSKNVLYKYDLACPFYDRHRSLNQSRELTRNTKLNDSHQKPSRLRLFIFIIKYILIGL